MEKNDNIKALQYLDKAIDSYSNSGSISGLIIDTFWKYWIYYKAGDKAKMKEYMNELRTYNQNNQDLRTTQLYQVSLAINSFYSEKSVIDENFVIQLQNILKTDNVIDIRVSIIAITILCSYKLFKLKLNNEERLKGEILSIIENIYSLGEKNRSYKFMVLSFILKTKFNLIIGNIDDCLKSVKEGLILAEKYGLTRLIAEIKEEEANVLNKIEIWYKGIPINPPLGEKIEDSNILDYLKEIMKIL